MPGRIHSSATTALRALSAVQRGDDVGALERLGGAAGDLDLESEREHVAHELGDGVGVDVVDAQLRDAERGAEGEGLELGLAPVPTIAMTVESGRASSFATNADVAAVRSAVSTVISARNVG